MKNEYERTKDPLYPKDLPYNEDMTCHQCKKRIFACECFFFVCEHCGIYEALTPQCNKCEKEE